MKRLTDVDTIGWTLNRNGEILQVDEDLVTEVRQATDGFWGTKDDWDKMPEMDGWKQANMSAFIINVHKIGESVEETSEREARAAATKSEIAKALRDLANQVERV